MCSPSARALPLPVHVVQLWGLWDGLNVTYADGGSTIRISPTPSLVLSAAIAWENLLTVVCDSAIYVVGGTGMLRMTHQFAITACTLWLVACVSLSLDFPLLSAHASCIGYSTSPIRGQQCSRSKYPMRRTIRGRILQPFRYKRRCPAPRATAHPLWLAVPDWARWPASEKEEHEFEMYAPKAR